MKNLLLSIVLIGLVITGFSLFLMGDRSSTGDVIKNPESLKTFNACLADSGMVIYGTDSCPYCRQLVELLGGYELVDLFYVDCVKEQNRCLDEMHGIGVPEIQINGEMFMGKRTLESFSQLTGCPLP